MPLVGAFFTLMDWKPQNTLLMVEPLPKGTTMPKNDHEKLDAFVSQMLKGRKLTELAPLFYMLGDLTRLRLLQALLTKGEQSVGELCEKLDLVQPTISHHLGLLRRHGFVVGVRTGKKVIYSAAK